MKKMFPEEINLSIYTADSEQALKYDFKSATNVLFQGEMIPLETALNEDKMRAFLTGKLS